jgi:hypothetical protein
VEKRGGRRRGSERNSLAPTTCDEESGEWLDLLLTDEKSSDDDVNE